MADTPPTPERPATGERGTPGTPEPRGWTDYSQEMRIHRNPALRLVYVGLGLVFVGLGAIGAFVPGLPTTVFVLIAAFFFARSSPRFYNWLMNHRLFGPLVRDFRAGRGVPLWVKIYAPAMIVLFAGSSSLWLAFGRERPWIGVLVAVVGLYGIVYILRLPTKAAS